MSTMPRWPELFPRMKERGARRRAGLRQSQRVTKIHQHAGAISTAMIAWSSVIEEVGRVAQVTADQLLSMVDSFIQSDDKESNS